MISKGDKIKIVVETHKDSRYKIGDIFEVAIACNGGDVYIDMNGEQPLWLTEDEFVKVSKKAIKTDSTSFEDFHYSFSDSKCQD